MWPLDAVRAQKRLGKVCAVLASKAVMGILINDTVTLPSGLDVAGTYASFGSSPLITYIDIDAQGDKKFTAAGNVSYYKDQASKSGGLDPVLEKRMVLPLATESVQAIYGLFYAGLAANYKDTSNVPDDVPAATMPGTAETAANTAAAAAAEPAAPKPEPAAPVPAAPEPAAPAPEPAAPESAAPGPAAPAPSAPQPAASEPAPAPAPVQPAAAT